MNFGERSCFIFAQAVTKHLEIRQASTANKDHDAFFAVEVKMSCGFSSSFFLICVVVTMMSLCQYCIARLLPLSIIVIFTVAVVLCQL